MFHAGAPGTSRLPRVVANLLRVQITRPQFVHDKCEEIICHDRSTSIRRVKMLTIAILSGHLGDFLTSDRPIAFMLAFDQL